MLNVLVIGKPSYEKIVDLCLIARAFGASGIVFTSEDKRLESKSQRFCKDICDKWGGKFSVSFTANWKSYLREKRNYKTIYLTRYGIPMKQMEYTIRTYKNVLAIVSFSEKIKELYTIADFNISITSQPHTTASSITALLRTYYHDRELSMHFENAKYKIIPEQHGIHIDKMD
ncbi:tRNA 2'-O-methylase [mine drainage metagenome]|uniref:tRNA (cytidine(56)-2'-O)-methyltransferase n=1 Tax=mine drainage metagenome TaxID=410659 RepID=T1B6S0_9ZZZZ